MQQRIGGLLLWTMPGFEGNRMIVGLLGTFAMETMELRNLAGQCQRQPIPAILVDVESGLSRRRKPKIDGSPSQDYPLGMKIVPVVLL